MIRDVQLVNFRVFRDVVVELAPGVTAVLGQNGAGKTSVLEGLHILGHGRSHRSSDRRPLISRDEEFSRVVANVDRRGVSPPARVALEFRRSGELLASVDREAVRTLSSVLHLTPVMLIDGDVQGMFSLGATYRRGLLDWGVFHVEHQFSETWREYQRALRQRNAALKLGSEQQAKMWNGSLCDAAERLHSMRAAYVAQIAPELERQVAMLLDRPATLSYRMGWTGDLSQALAEALPRDARLGFTTVGPHRADFLPGVSASAVNQLSRGQQKLLAIALLLAQIHVHAATDAPKATVLIDDAGADLDVDNLGKLYCALQSLPAQLVVTTIDERALKRLQIGRMFHVEQGMIRLLP